jgi:Ring finger domain
MASPSCPETPVTPAALAPTFLPSEEDMQATSLFSPQTLSPCSQAPSPAVAARYSGASSVAAASLASESIASRAGKRVRASKAPGKVPTPARKRAREVSPKKAAVEDEEEDSKPAAKETCCICMSDVEADDLAKISGCDHGFCFDCIEKWAERENTCPLCKIRFTKIDRVNKKRKRGQANTKKVKQRDQRSDLPGVALEGLLGKPFYRSDGRHLLRFSPRILILTFCNSFIGSTWIRFWKCSAILLFKIEYFCRSCR